MGEAEKVIGEGGKDVADPPPVVFIRRKGIDKPIENFICLWNVVGANQVFICDKLIRESLLDRRAVARSPKPKACVSPRAQSDKKRAQKSRR